MAYSIPAGENLRIVMIGKTGVGKSSVGNTILGEKFFKTSPALTSCTEVCDQKEMMFNGRMIRVVDTPGIIDVNKSQGEIQKEIVKCIQLACPGPHVFLLVMAIGRFTPEEQVAVQALQALFGERADNYMMVLFTNGDALEDQTIQQYVRNPEAHAFRQVLQRCGGRFHVFNNRSKDRHQVVDLIKMIDYLDAANGGTYYTNEMFKEAERVISQQPEPKAVAERKTYNFSFLAKLGKGVGIFLSILRGAMGLM